MKATVCVRHARQALLFGGHNMPNPLTNSSLHKYLNAIVSHRREQSSESDLCCNPTMETLTRQSLLSAENLMYPSVIAMTANLGCACCRQKVFQLISRMTGLREYTVDVRNKRVIVKGDVKVRWNTTTESLKGKMKKGPFKFFASLLKTNCINKHLVD